MTNPFGTFSSKTNVLIAFAFAIILFSVPFVSLASEAAFSKYYRAGASSAGNLGCPPGWTQTDSWSIDEGDSADGGGGTHIGLSCASGAYKAAFAKYYRTNNSTSFPPCPSGWTTVDTWAVQEGDKGDGGGGWHGGVACASNSYQNAMSKYYRERAGSRPQNAWAMNVDQCPAGPWTKIDSWSIYEGDGNDGGGGQHDGFACVYTGFDYTKTYTKYYRTNYPPDDYPATIPSCAAGWNRIDTWGVWEGDSADGGGNWHTGVACAAPVPPGTIQILATKDGVAWDSPAFTVSGTGIAGNPFSGSYDPPQTVTNPPGTITISSVTPPSPDVVLKDINGSTLPPSYVQNLTAGGAITYTFNFVTVPGTIQIRATKDGAPWDSPDFIANVSMPGGTQNVTMNTDAYGQQTFSGVPAGTYTINSIVKPADLTLKDVTPSYSQTLSGGGTIMFTINFVTVTVPTGTINIRATLTDKDGVVKDWDSPAFTVSGIGIAGNPFSSSYDPPQTITNPPGTITISSVTPPSPDVVLKDINGSTLPPSYVQTLIAGGAITYTFNFVTVTSPSPTLVVSPSSASVTVGGIQQFNAIYDPKDGSGPRDVTNSSLTSWSSSDNSIASINPTGSATGNVTGSVTITAQYSGLPASASLSVTAPVPTLVVTPTSWSLPIDGSHQFIATYDPDGSGPNPSQDVTATAAWSSSDASRVTVNNGLAKRIGNGMTSIIASYSGLSGSAIILDPARVSVVPSSPSLNTGETVQLSALFDPDGPAGPQAGRDVTASSNWSSSRPSIASVDNASVKGLTKAIAAGLASITASYNGLSGQSSIRVNAPPAPPLTVSCSASPTSTTTGKSVTWTAVASGGTGSYSYSWSGSTPLAGRTGNPVTISYSTAGTKTGSVRVTSGSQVVSQPCGTSVTVGTPPPPPTATLSANPETIDKGNSSKLTWSSANADSCTGVGFDTGDAANNSSGVSVSPSATSDYQISCTGAGGSVTSPATVTVISVTASISASPSCVQGGGNTKISWSATPASQVASCAISGPGLSSNQISGSQTLKVTSKSTYSIACQTKGGSEIPKQVIVDTSGCFAEF